MGKKPAIGEKHYHETAPVPQDPLETVQPNKYRCELCGKTFRTHTEVDRHRQTQHGVVEGREPES